VADPPVMKQAVKNNASNSIYSSFLYSRLRLFLHSCQLNQKGFSVVEVLVVSVLIGVICTIAVPNMSVMMKTNQLRSAANDLASALQLARITAISQNANSVMKFNTGNQSYLFFSDNGTGGGTANDGVQSGTEPTIKTINIPNEYSNQVTMSTPSFGATNYFNSQGICSQSGSITLQNSSGESRQIVIAQGGSIKVVKP
jgi:type II secretion system protein H